MARDYEDRKRQREEEDEADAAAELAKKTTPGSSSKSWPTIDIEAARGAGVEKLIELMDRAEPLIEQLNALYQQYITGVESRPPIERRTHLDQVMTALQMMAKPTATYQFRYQSILQSYHTHRERWERLCKDLETGKIRRVAGPKRR